MNSSGAVIGQNALGTKQKVVFKIHLHTAAFCHPNIPQLNIIIRTEILHCATLAHSFCLFSKLFKKLLPI